MILNPSLLCVQSLLTDEQIAAAPVLILGNKIDMPGAASEDELRHMFGLHGQTTGKVLVTLKDSILSYLAKLSQIRQSVYYQDIVESYPRAELYVE